MNVANELGDFLVSEGIKVTPEMWIRDWSGHVPEVDSSEIFWVIPADHSHSVMILRLPNGELQIINTPESRGLLSSLLKLPNPNNYDEVESFVRHTIAIMFDPRFVICDRRFGEYSDLVLNTYILHPEHGVPKLRSLCSRNATLDVNDFGWSVSVRILEHSGAIRDIMLVSSFGADGFQRISVDEYMPSGSFNLADEY